MQFLLKRYLVRNCYQGESLEKVVVVEVYDCELAGYGKNLLGTLLLLKHQAGLSVLFQINLFFQSS